MRIPIGRRQLVVSVVSDSCQDEAEAFPMALNATDAELARLNSTRAASLDRARWESTAIMYGAVRLRTA